MNDTWEDVERAALNDPVLHAMLTYVRQGISRTPDGTFSARKLEPTSVVIHQKPPQEKKR
jgi:hypothetical protein